MPSRFKTATMEQDQVTSAPKSRVAFYAARYSPRKASIRLRVLEPIAALRDIGVEAGRYPRLRSVDDCAAVVISKAFGRGAIKAAATARRQGCGLIFDICDNRYAGKQTPLRAAKARRTSALLASADIVTVPTQRMGDLLVECAPDIAGRVRVVPDMLDDVAGGSGASLSLLDRFWLSRLDRFHMMHDGALHCVWFGNNMAGVSGLDQIGPAIAELRHFAQTHPVTLTIISNKAGLYRRASREWGIPSFYLPWSLGSFGTALRAHRVAIIPVARNAYSAGKSINRPATAIMAGLGVIADSIQSYEELRPFIALDDWQGGLSRYAYGWEAEADRLAQARAHLDARYGRQRVAERWREIFAELAARSLPDA
jgi:hypothetical protein